MCKCCEEINFWQRLNKKEAEEGNVECEILAKLSTYSWRKKGTITSKPYNLNYCPMCRKKVG